MCLAEKAAAHLHHLEMKLKEEYERVQSMMDMDELPAIRKRLNVCSKKITGVEYKEFFIHAECGKLRLTQPRGSSLSHDTVEEKS